MGKLVQQTLADLRDTAALEAGTNDAIWFAGDLLHRFHSDFRWPSAFDFIDAETVTPAEADALKQAVTAALDNCTSLAVKGRLLSALQQTRDPHSNRFTSRASKPLLGSSKAAPACCKTVSTP